MSLYRPYHNNYNYEGLTLIFPTRATHYYVHVVQKSVYMHVYACIYESS